MDHETIGRETLLEAQNKGSNCQRFCAVSKVSAFNISTSFSLHAAWISLIVYAFEHENDYADKMVDMMQDAAISLVAINLVFGVVNWCLPAENLAHNDNLGHLFTSISAVFSLLLSCLVPGLAMIHLREQMEADEEVTTLEGLLTAIAVTSSMLLALCAFKETRLQVGAFLFWGAAGCLNLPTKLKNLCSSIGDYFRGCCSHGHSTGYQEGPA